MTEIYSKSTDFSNGLDPYQLQSEITDNLSITIKVARIDTLGDVVSIVFLSQISSNEKAILDAIVAAHKPKQDQPLIVKVKEEFGITGENFQITTLNINAAANTTIKKTTSWPYPISGLLMGFISEETHRGDVLQLTANENTTIGNITSNVSPATAWNTQNYTVGQIVTYNTGDVDFGTRVYTCVVNTVNNELPVNKLYWRHGLRFSVSQTVVDNTMIGQHIILSDGINNDNVGRILYMDKANKWIYAEINPSHSFLSATPTYVILTVYAIIDYEIGAPGRYLIGDGKIGGAYIPEDTKITLHYENKSPTNAKYFSGFIELLY